MNTVRLRVCAESWLFSPGEKSFAPQEESNQHQHCTWLFNLKLYQPSPPTPTQPPPLPSVYHYFSLQQTLGCQLFQMLRTLGDCNFKTASCNACLKSKRLPNDTDPFEFAHVGRADRGSQEPNVVDLCRLCACLVVFDKYLHIETMNNAVSLQVW